MKILFVSQWYYPEPDGRVSALAEGLVENGHDVMVVTGFPNYPKGKLYDGYRIKWRQREMKNGVKILRLPLYPNHSNSSLKRALNYLSFSLSLFILSPWLIKKPDIIWSYTPFVAMPTIWLHKLFRVPYVMEIADIWPDTIISTGMMKEGFVLNLLSSMAKFAYKYAAAITVQNTGFKPCLVERGADANKVFIIENWADEKLYHIVDYDLELAKKYKMNDKFNVVFAGNLGMGQGLDNIVQAAKLCQQESDIQFVFIGDGVCLTDIKNNVDKEGLNNVIFIGRKPASEMSYFFALSDVLLVSLKDDPIFEITMPSKTQSYLACGRPIIIAKRGADAEELQRNGCALHCEPDNPVALANSVKQIFNMNPADRKLMGEKGVMLYEKKFRRSLLLKKMEKVLINAA